MEFYFCDEDKQMSEHPELHRKDGDVTALPEQATSETSASSFFILFSEAM